MRYDPERHQRRATRLPGYDYALPGGYFVTICTHDRQCLFGEITDSAMQLNRYGDIVRDQLLGLPTHYPHIEIDAWVIMPNHVHAIIALGDYDSPHAPVGEGFQTLPSQQPHADKPSKPLKRHALPEIVRGMKTYSARTINRWRESPGVPVWQRSFYEHIIRDEQEWLGIRWYIEQNPVRWAEDRDFPENWKD